MKRKLLALSRRYLAALQKYLRPVTGARASPARRLGDEALALGLAAPDLARIHEIAVATLVAKGRSPAARSRLTRQAEVFLAEASLAVGKTPRAKTVWPVQLVRQNQLLTQRTAQLTVTNRRLKQGIVRQRSTEKVFTRKGRLDAKVLLESQQLQKQLRHLTHQLLAAQEVERTKISRELHDEVAQTLLGIHVRLLTLKKAAQGDTAHLRKVIASTQLAVKQSIHSINRFAHELDTHQPA